MSIKNERFPLRNNHFSTRFVDTVVFRVTCVDGLFCNLLRRLFWLLPKSFLATSQKSTLLAKKVPLFLPLIRIVQNRGWYKEGVVWDGDVGKFRPPSGCVCAGPTKYIPQIISIVY